MEKPSNEHTTSVKRERCEWVDQYLDIYTLKRIPITKLTIERMAADLIKWAKETKDAFTISEFYLDRGIPHSTYSKLIVDHKILTEAHQTALLFLANRREKGALQNKLNTTMVMSQQARYDAEWWSLEQKRAKLKAESQSKSDENVRYTIVVDSYAEKEKDGKETKPEI